VSSGTVKVSDKKKGLSREENNMEKKETILLKGPLKKSAGPFLGRKKKPLSNRRIYMKRSRAIFPERYNRMGKQRRVTKFILRAGEVGTDRTKKPKRGRKGNRGIGPSTPQSSRRETNLHQKRETRRKGVRSGKLPSAKKNGFGGEINQERSPKKSHDIPQKEVLPVRWQ